jgi:hypothetical protein
MTELREGRTPAPQAKRNASRGVSARLRAILRLDPLSGAVLGLGLAAAALLALSDFTTLYRVDVGMASCSDLAEAGKASTCAPSAGSHHLYALVVLGAFALVMSFGAAIGRSRAAGGALVAAGAAALAIVMLRDLPDVHDTGFIGASFNGATAEPAIGYKLELAGACLALAAGCLRLVTTPRRR